MTATDFTPSDSGSSPPSFRRSTIDCLAASSASCLCSAQSFTEIGICAYGTTSGGSNIPSRIRASKSRTSARSMSSSVSRPFSTANVRAAYVHPQFRSQPAFTASAAASSAVSTSRWCRQMSPMAPQSETT